MGAVHNTKGRDISTGPGQPPQQGQGPDFYKLVDDTVAGHRGAVRDLDMAGQKRPSGNDRIVPQPAIMRHMRMLHEIIIVADNRGTLSLCPAVNLAVLAHGIAVTDPEKTSFTRVREVLRGVADDRPHMDFIVFADFGPAAEYGVGKNPRSASNPDSAVNHNIGADVNAGVNVGLRGNNGCRMDRHT